MFRFAMKGIRMTEIPGTPAEAPEGGRMGGITRRSLLIGGGLVGAAVVAAGVTYGISRPGQAGTGKAATIVKNGVVWTGHPNRFADAIAIDSQGMIIAVGTLSEIKALSGPNTEVIDAGGGTVMPGIQDGHAHTFNGAESSARPTDENTVGTIDELVKRVQGFLDDEVDAGPDEWLMVVDWNPTGLTDGVAHRKYLDKLATKRPIYLRGSDLHNAWVNSRALELAGVTASTPSPAGGEIVQDADGPTGLLKDSAQKVVSSIMPELTEMQKLKSYKKSFAMLAGVGITSFMDAAGPGERIQKFADLSDRGVIPQRVRVAIHVADEQLADPKATVAELNTFRTKFKNHPMVSAGTAKIFMDGVAEYPAHTAAMIDPYLDEQGNTTDDRGELYVSADDFARMSTELDAQGWQIHTHAIGDLAVRTSLDGFEQAQKQNSGAKNRHTITHVQFCSPNDFHRFAENQVIANMSTHWATPDTFTVESMLPYMGPERHKFQYPTGSLFKAGATLSGGSDWPIDPLIPWNQIQTAVDRAGLWSETGEALHPEQGISLNDSILMHTSGSAFQMFQDDTTGSIAVGKKADIVILDRDLFGVAIAEVSGATVNYTLINGEVVHDINTAAGSQSASTASAAASAVVSTEMKRHEACCMPMQTV